MKKRKRCIYKKKDGEPCKLPAVSNSDYCHVHIKKAHRDVEAKRKERITIEVSAYNLSRMEWIIARPEINVETHDELIDWLFRVAKSAHPTIRFQLDIWEHAMRNPL